MFLYSVWFTNTFADKDDQDYEWVACILIDAPSHQKAAEWGDYLASRYSLTNPEEVFVKSGAKSLSYFERENLSGLPSIKYGYEATDSEIGW